MKKKTTEKQKEQARKRREKFAQLYSQVKAMPKEEIQAVADELSIITVEDHPLSAVNTILLSYQRENVTVVGGFRQWLNKGRAVKKGEHGLAIWVPSTKKVPNAPDPEKEETFFFMGTVFDISQTEIAKEQPNA
jgi:hypothetical protein